MPAYPTLYQVYSPRLLGQGALRQNFTKSGSTASFAKQFGPFRPYQLSSKRNRLPSNRSLKVKAIGFDLGGSSGASARFDKKAANLLREAKRVLVYQSILKTKPAEAFLSLLRSLQQSSKDDIISAYSTFYQELSRTQSKTWREFILEEILIGRGNAWAKEVSQGDVKSKKLQAAAHDLRILQQLACENEQIVELVRDALPEVPDVWVRAALNAGGSSSPDSGKELTELLETPDAQQSNFGPNPPIQAPIKRQQKSEMMASIASMENWSDATSILTDHYQKHGFGLTGQNAVLLWKNGALTAFSDSYTDTSGVESERENVGIEYKDWANWPVAQFRTPLHASSSIFQDLCAYSPLGLRTVLVSSAERNASFLGGELLALFRALRPHNRMMFLVMVALDDEDASGEGAMSSIIIDLKAVTPKNVAVQFSIVDSPLTCL